MIKQLSKLWRWSWVVTLPVAVVFIFWSTHTLQRMYRFGVRYDPAPGRRITLVDMGRLEFRHLLRNARIMVDQFGSPFQPQPSDLRSVDVFVGKADLVQLNAHLPYSGLQYVPATLWDGDQFIQAKLRYRGDFPRHWGLYKKSWRIKTSKKMLFNGMRTFNLIVPEERGQLNNYFAYQLADAMGLIAPRTEVVELSVNGKPRGWHVLVEQLDEITLRSHNRMPGDLFAGELIAKDRYIGVSENVFEHPGLWKKIAVNNHYPEDARASIQRLIDLVRSPPSEKRQQHLSQLLDMKSWGCFSAFETLAQSFHYDNTHNWRLYFDPGTSRLIPVVWDPLGWAPMWMPRENQDVHQKIISSQLHHVLFQNGDFVKARQQQLDRFFDSGMDRKFRAEVDKMIRKLEPSVFKDPHADDLDSEKVIANMRTLEANIGRTFRALNTDRLDPGVDHRYHYRPKEGVLAIALGGQRPVRSLVMRFQYPVREVASTWIRYRQQGRIQEKDVSGALKVKGANLLFEIDLLPPPEALTAFGRKNNFDCLRPKNPTADYELMVNGLDPDNPLLEVFVDLGLGHSQRVGEVDRLAMNSFEDLYLVVHEHPSAPPLIWQGRVTIEGVRVIEKELVILPGTEIRFLPGAGLIIKQRLLARGEPHRWIRFLPAHRGQAPWGAVVLHGIEAKGSLLENCEFVGGSGLKGDLFEYSAMFSVHDVPEVTVTGCRFKENHSVDDMVHAVYAGIRFQGCEFTGAQADALDLDICDAVVDRCRFRGSGNDALDLMATRAVVLDTLLTGNGDKGISVGEGSRLFALNDTFSGNKIGIQSKDGSVAVAYNSDFRDNALAIDAYRKNWRYGGGGKVFIYKSKIVGNAKMITADKRSDIWVYDTFVDREVDTKKRIQVHATVDSNPGQRARESHYWRFPEDTLESTVLDRNFLGKLDPTRRGVH